MIVELVNAHLNRILPDNNTTLAEAMRYAVLSGGKRLRPLLALEVAAHYGTEREKALTAACSIELIHAYSLIHDDLPCMDDDDFRRGKPTVHKQFSEATAVLAGDALLTFTFELISSEPTLSLEQRIKLIQVLAQASGHNGMISGQMQDIAAEDRTISYEELRTIHARKTGALFTASALIGGIVANVTSEEFAKLQKLGQNIGLAFQILDDVQDITHSEEKHGGKVSSDVRNNKATYVKLLGLEQARRLADDELHKAARLGIIDPYKYASGGSKVIL